MTRTEYGKLYQRHRRGTAKARTRVPGIVEGMTAEEKQHVYRQRHYMKRRTTESHESPAPPESPTPPESPAPPAPPAQTQGRTTR